MVKRFIYPFLLSVILSGSCKKETEPVNPIVSDYSGTYSNAEYVEIPIGEFNTGIYRENEIPDEVKQLQYGRIEIDFQYNGGGLDYFMPLFYYGSENKNRYDDDVEEPKFHLAIEIGHYNVIPFPVEYLFYTYCTYRQPQYCRDTFSPVITGGNYTFIVDKKPEGTILQLRKGSTILNIFPHAFFPDSTQFFFKNITAYIDKNKGDTLQKVLMIGKGYAGIEKGIHNLNGAVTSVRIIKYSISNSSSGYELMSVRNQHNENQLIEYTAIDKLSGSDKFLQLTYEFYPYRFIKGELIPDGQMQAGESGKTQNGKPASVILKNTDIGFYKVFISTLDKDNNVLRSTTKPFEIWIYPKEWDFEFYK